MGAFNGFHLIGVAKSDLYTPFPNSKAPQQCFLLEVPNGDGHPFAFAVFLNPLSKTGDFASLKGKTLAVSGMLRSFPVKDQGKLPMLSVVAYDIKPLRAPKAKKAGDYE